MKIRRSLACLLAALVLAPAFGQAPQSTPRELYERAAFAEEHDHDLAAAENGFRAAADAATRAGDAELAKKAGDAHARVLTRQGKAPAPQEQPSELFPQAQRLIAEGSSLPKGEDATVLINDLLVFGRALVPVFERMLTQPSPENFELGDWTVTVNPSFAAHVLAQIDVPEAAQALAKGLESPDPLVRRAVVGQLWDSRFSDLLERAAADPVPAVRELAIQRLAGQLNDPDLRPLMIAAAQAGNTHAMAWLARSDPWTLFDLIDQVTVDDSALRAIGRSSWPAYIDADTAIHLARLHRSARSENVRSKANEVLNDLLSSAMADSKITSELEEALVSEIVKDPAPAAIERLGYITPRRAFEVAIEILETSSDPLDDAEQNSYYSAFNRSGRMDPLIGDAAGWIRAYRSAVGRTDWVRAAREELGGRHPGPSAPGTL